MQIFILNFSRTRVDSVVQALGLNSIDPQDILKEYKIQDFYEDSFYKILKEVELINNSMEGGGAIMLAFNYPLLANKDKECAKEFYRIAKNSEENLYYYPKPNHYMEVDDFAFFVLKNNLTPENLKIESLYQRELLQRDLRGKLHVLLRKDKQIEEKYINKKFFYESRKLFNLSWKWKEYQVSQEQLEYDLIERVGEWYPGPTMVNIATINICNLKCIMCPLHSEEARSKEIASDYFDKKQLLATDKVYEVLDYIADYSINPAVGFIASGEPLLDNRLVNFIAHAKHKKIELIAITTNGTLIEEKGRELFEAGLNRMTISIDGATPETYRKIRGADLEKVERGVRKCVEYAREINVRGGKIEMQLNCVLVNREVFNEKDLYLEKWKDCRDVIKNIYFTDLTISNTKGRLNKNNVSCSDVCSLPWLGFQVDVYGNVSVCCTMQDSSLREELVSVGNIYEHSSYDIWRSELIKKLRRENLMQKYCRFEICKDCIERYKMYTNNEGILDNLIIQLK